MTGAIIEEYLARAVVLSLDLTPSQSWSACSLYGE